MEYVLVTLLLIGVVGFGSSGYYGMYRVNKTFYHHCLKRSCKKEYIGYHKLWAFFFWALNLFYLVFCFITIFLVSGDLQKTMASYMLLMFVVGIVIGLVSLIRTTDSDYPTGAAPDKNIFDITFDKIDEVWGTYKPKIEVNFMKTFGGPLKAGFSKVKTPLSKLSEIVLGKPKE
ncbi:hypothetical protein [Pseudoalteromonas phage J2-1_QLiu-2017]|nr:hypothetical protein [Pseudoalteromonas phage J2-1_QLiu-2017]